MAPNSSDRGGPALLDLVTLISLLSLRGVNTLRPTAQCQTNTNDFDEDAVLEDEYDSSDTEIASNAGQEEPLGPPDKLRKRFLDRLAEQFAAERNGSFVTAAVLREVEREDRVDIWLARNNGFEIAGDKEMIKAIETELNELARDGDRGTADLQGNMLRYSSRRLDSYNGELKELLTAHKVVLQKIAQSYALSTSDECAQVWSSVHSHVFDTSSTETDLQRAESLVSLGTDARRAIHAGKDLSILLGKSAEVRKAIKIFCFAGKIGSACRTFTEATTGVWRGYTFQVNHIAVPRPAYVAKASTDIASAFKRVGVPDNHIVTRTYGNKPKDAAKFARAQEQSPYVHAEVQLLFHLARNRILDVFPYMGSSKLPCVLCAALLKLDGTLACRESHEHFYAKWMVPKMKNLPPDVIQRMWSVIAGLREELKAVLLSLPEKGGDLRAESTVDMTVISGPSSSTSSDMSPVFSLARKQQQQAEEQKMLSRRFELLLGKKSESNIEADERVEDECPTLPQHGESDSGEDEAECGGCPRLTRRPCGRCGTDRFCSSSCEKRMSPTHKFTCSNGALTTADVLLLDCIQDEIPQAPDVLEDFGFKRLSTFPERSKLLGLYISLLHLDVEADELDGWRKSGVLPDRIVETFEKIPLRSRVSYFPWFVENRHLIFPPTPLSAPEDDGLERIFQPARYLLEPSDRLKPVRDLHPSSRRSCFWFAALLMQSTHPSPELVGPYYDFVFCACRDEAEEYALAALYQRLIFGDACDLERLYYSDVPTPTSTSTSHANATRFVQFWQAFEKGELIQLMDSSGLKQARNSIRHLATYLDGPIEVQELPVWKLLSLLKTGDAASLPHEVFIPSGFVRCTTSQGRGALKEFYASLLACADILQLQHAQAAGRILEFARQYVDVGPVAEILG